MIISRHHLPPLNQSHQIKKALIEFLSKGGMQY